MSSEIKKRKEDEINGEDTKVTKLPRQNLPSLKIKSDLESTPFLDEVRSAWGSDDFDKNNVKLGNKPFLHAEIAGILEEPGILKELNEVLIYEEKSSDLFHFHQSCDLSSVPKDCEGFQEIQALSEFFQTTLFNAIKHITGLPLSGKFDIFASQYEITDHLLCHDDELDSRRVAFIIYMSEVWKQEYGGTLDLFDSTENESGPYPGRIIKSIVPEFNKIAFFEVTAKSFHQVSEVVQESACRRAISGWYYGEPLPRPSVTLPEDAFKNVNYLDRKEIALDEFVDPLYLNPDTLRSANDQLSENSEILLSSFFKPDLYKVLAKKLEAIESSQWESMGPANLRQYKQLPSSDPAFPPELLEFFGSKSFLEFLQELTEFPFASEPELRFYCSLKKFQNGSYTLVRGKDRSYKLSTVGSVSKFEDSNDTEGEGHESDSDADEQLKNVALNPNSNHAVAKVNGHPDENGIEEPEETKSTENGFGAVPENANTDQNSGNEQENSEEEPENSEEEPENSEEEEDPDKDEAIELEYEEDEEEEDEGPEILDMEGEESGEPNRVDIMFFIIPSKDSETSTGWEETWGGNRIYTDDLTGNQLINVAPASNSLAVVVRDGSISSHYSYTNCLASKNIFYCYDFEFDFPIGGC
ncbi:unnamed protein product [Allacma fusca]|uniref:Prolyl 4-hydroxylase alpha subunit domain-containing protein n=1 Tax=Allacma fusca TaxID=39272 RepID=A0A8J2PJV6_9HEXA|nr:unnamed protein product [Allacma fusca]